MTLTEWKRQFPEKARELGRITGLKNRGTTFIGTGKIVAGQKNIHAIEWHLISPAGREYQFKCLAEFVNQHQNLFEPKDLIRKTRTGDTNAQKQLSKLNPEIKHVRGSWKGWTWYHPYLP